MLSVRETLTGPFFFLSLHHSFFVLLTAATWLVLRRSLPTVEVNAALQGLGPRHALGSFSFLFEYPSLGLTRALVIVMASVS
jgi:hypothetical protein